MPVELLLKPIRMHRRVKVVYIDYRERIGVEHDESARQVPGGRLRRILSVRFSPGAIRHMNVGILGGGITGITLQRYLQHDSEVLEAAGRPGGLCSTIFKDGFGYDIGGHILFSKNEQINQLVERLLGDNCGQARRANQIYFKKRFVKYPFENGLGVT